jgi:2-hydroxychromene-2-carboxylate isomerase
MPAVIDYFFTSISPWAYLGHDAVLKVAARHGAELRPRPFNIAEVFATSGAVPLAQRPVPRQRYRLVELQRFSAMRNVKLNLHPRYFPADPTLADHCVAALVISGGRPLDFVGRAMSGLWTRDENLADPETIRSMLAETGHDADAVLRLAGSPEVAELRARNTADAIASGAVGAPCYVLNGEPFWGQDRIGLLDDALASGRPPYSPEA